MDVQTAFLLGFNVPSVPGTQARRRPTILPGAEGRLDA
jgi:hypothetical protein